MFLEIKQKLYSISKNYLLRICSKECYFRKTI